MTLYFVTMTITSVLNGERRYPITWAGEITHDEDAHHDADAPSSMHRMYASVLDRTKGYWHRRYQGISDDRLSSDRFVVDNYTVLRTD